jgi:hypothetical protein
MKEYTNNTKKIGKRIMCTIRLESRAGRGTPGVLLPGFDGVMAARRVSEFSGVEIAKPQRRGLPGLYRPQSRFQASRLPALDR